MSFTLSTLEGYLPFTRANLPLNTAPHSKSEAQENWASLFEIILGLQKQINDLNATVAAATTATAVVAWRYDTSSHKFQIKTQLLTVFAAGAASAWTDNPDGTQPSLLGDGSISTTVIDVDWNSRTSNALTERVVSSVYVLEKGSASTTTIDAAVTC